MQAIDKARLCSKIIMERKALDPVLLNMKDLTSFADYFLITSGNSTRQVQAISSHVQKTLREEGFRPFGTEGEQEGHWVLMDYGDVIIHIFYQPVREFYDLEGLWIDAPKISVDEE